MRRFWLALICVTAWGASPNPAAVLKRVLTKMRESVRIMPNYTCVETVTREFYTPIAPVKRDCEVMLELKKHPTLDMTLRFVLRDRYRLEVAMGSNGELHSWVGASRFDDQSIDRLIPQGPIGSGLFGGVIAAIFTQDVQRFRFEEELMVNGALRYAFSFVVPKDQSHYKVKIGKDWIYTAYSGRFELDPVREEVTRIVLDTAILPPAAVTCRTSTEVELEMMTIGAGSFPLTKKARQHYVAQDGEETTNRIEFANCREYRGESNITYYAEDASAGAPSSGSAPAAVRAPVPGRLNFTMELTAPIDLSVAAAGDRFTGRLRAPLTPLRGKVIAPKGAPVEGRLVRVMVSGAPRPEGILVMRPESVNGIPLDATQDLDAALKNRRRGMEILLPFPWEGNAGVFRFPGERPVVPKGFTSYWRSVER